MKAYILKTGRRISPYGDPPGDVLVLNRPLVDIQKEVLASVGLEPEVIDDPSRAAGTEFFLILDHVFITHGALRLFRDEASRLGRSSALAIPEGKFTAFTEPLASLREARDEASGRRLVLYDVFYFKGEGYSTERAASLPPVPIDIREREQKLSLPPHVKETQYVGVSGAIVLHVDHWVHILFANLLGGVAWLFTLARSPKVWLWALWRLVAAFPWTRRRVRSTFVRKGRGCSIHPTATIEGAILGDGVRVDAGAVIRGSIIGSHSTIGTNANIVGVVMGERCNIGWNGIIQMCVLYPGVWVSFPGLQLAVVGRDTFLATGLWPYDTSFEGKIKLKAPDGHVVETPYYQIGSAYGHNVSTGANISIAAGREIPNGIRILPDLAKLLRRVRDDVAAGAMYTIENGSLVEMGGAAKTRKREESEPQRGPDESREGGGGAE